VTQFHDPVTGKSVPDREPLVWDQTPSGDAQAVADALCTWLDARGRSPGGREPEVPMVPHAPDSYVTDHALLASAIAYCLAYEREGLEEVDRHAIRLAVLAHELALVSREKIVRCLPDQTDFFQQAWQIQEDLAARLVEALRSEDGLALFGDVQPETEDVRLEILWYAHVAASSQLHNHTWPDPRAPGGDGRKLASLRSRADFERHPLHCAGQVALVWGGATKIKGYVFESARLPEIRGASSLFDRLNTLDVPALWGRQPQRGDYRSQAAHQSALERYRAVRERLAQVVAQEQLSEVTAPECVLYASGGNVLALAPVSVASTLAKTIEELYTTETLVGNSVAVAVPFELLELQYGRRPGDYWLEEFERDVASKEHRPLLESYYQGTEARDFIARKGFGELVTLLAGEASRRRAGPGESRAPRAIPHYELLPHTIKCHSCDIRPALVTIDQAEVPPNQSPKVFCEPCARKRVTGQVAKRDEARAERWFTRHFDWYPHGVASWEGLFEGFLETNPELRKRYMADVQAQEGDPGSVQVKAAEDIQEIGAAASPSGYAGFIYADGNDVGALVARIRTPAAYRQFGQRLYQASQAAVFAALSQHLGARWQEKSASPEESDRDKIWIHPFEIITIGGDDFTIIVPGDQTLPIAVTIARELEGRLSGLRPAQTLTPQQKRERERYAPPDAPTGDLWTEAQWPVVSVSAGVVIARDHTPVSYVSKLAEQLQKSAKRDRKLGAHAGYPGGTVDFAALKATGMVSLPWSNYRQRAFNTEGELQLTSRPFTWHELAGLLETAKILKLAHFPRSQMYRLQEDVIAQNRLAASVNYLYFLSHLDEQLRPLVIAAFQQAWHRRRDVPPWREVQGDTDKFETIWRDLVEIYDFIRQPDNEANGKENE
jgi:CRISPR-associated protein Cmr2